MLRIFNHFCLGGDSLEPLTSSQILGCSGVSKMCASIATYPHEVVRTRLQIQRRLLDRPAQSSLSQNGSLQSSSSSHSHSQATTRKSKGIVYVVKRILSTEGWRGLYKGLSVNLVRTVPNSAVTMLTYVEFSLVKHALID